MRLLRTFSFFLILYIECVPSRPDQHLELYLSTSIHSEIPTNPESNRWIVRLDECHHQLRKTTGLGLLLASSFSVFGVQLSSLSAENGSQRVRTRTTEARLKRHTSLVFADYGFASCVICEGMSMIIKWRPNHPLRVLFTTKSISFGEKLLRPRSRTSE